jgi:hypothetical protein
MKIRLGRAVFGDGRIDVQAWNAHVLADAPVGCCGCGALAYGLKITRGHRLVFATAVCRRCDAEAAMPVRDVARAA